MLMRPPAAHMASTYKTRLIQDTNVYVMHYAERPIFMLMIL